MPTPTEPCAGASLDGPVDVGGGHVRDAGHAQLFRLAFDAVLKIAFGICVGVRRARRDAGPLRIGAGEEEAEIKAAAVRGLQVVDPREAFASQAVA